MSSKFDKLFDAGLIKPPNFLKSNIIYECITGSHAYGCNTPDKSDFDIVGIAIPLKEYIFPHLANELYGWDMQVQRFEQFQQHHLKFNDKEQYDITVFSIVKYFRLAADNNPNALDILYSPYECITHINQIGQIMRENRHKFLHKGCYHKLKGYSYSQFHKMSSNKRTGNRKEIHETWGYDLKFGFHAVRLLLQCEQILQEGDLDLRRNSEIYKSIRRGEWTEKDIIDFVAQKEPYLEKLYQESKLPFGPDEREIKSILLSCLEHHFGSLDKCITNLDKHEIAIREIQKIVGNL